MLALLASIRLRATMDRKKPIVHGMSPIMNTKSHALPESDGTSDLINQVHKARKNLEENKSKSHAVLRAIKAMEIIAQERLERADQEKVKVSEIADRQIEETMRQIRSIVGSFSHETQNAPKPWLDKISEFTQQINSAAANSPLAQRQRRFVNSVGKGDCVYVLSLNCQGYVQKIRRKKQTIILLINGKEVEVPFTQIWPAKKI